MRADNVVKHEQKLPADVKAAGAAVAPSLLPYRLMTDGSEFASSQSQHVKDYRNDGWILGFTEQLKRDAKAKGQLLKGRPLGDSHFSIPYSVFFVDVDRIDDFKIQDIPVLPYRKDENKAESIPYGSSRDDSVNARAVLVEQIKRLLKLNDDEVHELLTHYRQDVLGGPVNILTALALKGFPEKKIRAISSACKTKWYRNEKTGVIYSEVEERIAIREVNVLLEDGTRGERITKLPGYYVSRFIFTENGFKLESVSCTNALLKRCLYETEMEITAEDIQNAQKEEEKLKFRVEVNKVNAELEQRVRQSLPIPPEVMLAAQIQDLRKRIDGKNDDLSLAVAHVCDAVSEAAQRFSPFRPNYPTLTSVIEVAQKTVLGGPNLDRFGELLVLHSVVNKLPWGTKVAAALKILAGIVLLAAFVGLALTTFGGVTPPCVAGIYLTLKFIADAWALTAASAAVTGVTVIGGGALVYSGTKTCLQNTSLGVAVNRMAHLTGERERCRLYQPAPAAPAAPDPAAPAAPLVQPEHKA